MFYTQTHEIIKEMKIAIIGWWAAGMMAWAIAAEAGGNHEIHIFEKNRKLWTKVLISGWWRCNVTTGYFKKQDLQSKYIRGWDFLQHAMSSFWPRKMRQRVEEHNVPLKCEEDMRVFPQSDNWADVVWIFEKIFHEKKVHIHFSEWVEKLEHSAWVFSLTTKSGTYAFDKVVITTWGNAYAHTGSSGDWYELAKTVGHTTTPLWPSLNSFLVSEEWIKTLSWISFSHAQISYEKAKVIWPVLLTHFGTSGPAVFAFSAHSSFETVSKDQPLQVRLTPFAERNLEWRTKRLNELVIGSPKKQINTVLWFEFPDRFADALIESVWIIPDKKIADLSREEKQLLCKTLWEGISLHLIARRPWDEFVTAWWINTDEIDPDTMESKLCPWLYFAGEVINVDGVTGWYNLQACWATGYAAGKAISEKN